MKQDQRLCIIGSPLEFGSGVPGAMMSPMALRYEEFFDILRCSYAEVEDFGDIPIVYASQIDTPPCRKVIGKTWQYSDAVQRVVEQHLERLATLVCERCMQSQIPLVLGGDHAIAIGSLWGVRQACSLQKISLGIVWLDAHLDLHTPSTSPSGNLHGMALSYALSGGDRGHLTAPYDVSIWDKPQVMVIGARSMEYAEKGFAQKQNITVSSMCDLESAQGWQKMFDALNHMILSVDHIHLSCDMDVFDPTLSPGVSTPVPGGLSWSQGRKILSCLYQSQKLKSFDLSELNPLRDVDRRTSRLASQVITTAFGSSAFSSLS